MTDGACGTPAVARPLTGVETFFVQSPSDPTTQTCIQCAMRDFFGELLCECLSFDLVRLAVTAPDERMEITGLLVSCVDCSGTFYEPVDSMPAVDTDL